MSKTMDLYKDDIMAVLKIENMLENKGYHVLTETDAVTTIIENHIDMSDYELPYGCHTVDEWKKIIEKQTACESDDTVYTDMFEQYETVINRE